VVNIIVRLFVGGAFGSMLREFIMQIVPHLAYNFPLDILVANLAADFLLGLPHRCTAGRSCPTTAT